MTTGGGSYGAPESVSLDPPGSLTVNEKSPEGKEIKLANGGEQQLFFKCTSPNTYHTYPDKEKRSQP